MESVFESMAKDRSVIINSTHWASLINSWGCVTKDLERSLAIFESIATHPSTAKSPVPLPDAVCYEAIINVLVSHHRMDLAARYVQKLQDSNVHMTAYVANVLIRGYAASGDLESARRIFEGLVDPPSGYAAVHNHAAHEAEQPHLVPAEAPVYREVRLFLYLDHIRIVQAADTLYFIISLPHGKLWFVLNLVLVNVSRRNYCWNEWKRGKLSFGISDLRARLTYAFFFIDTIQKALCNGYVVSSAVKDPDRALLHHLQNQIAFICDN